MRSILPLLLALACPVGMCLVPMLLARRKGGDQRHAGCAGMGSRQQGGQQDKELHRLRTEVETLRAELAEQQASENEAPATTRAEATEPSA